MSTAGETAESGPTAAAPAVTACPSSTPAQAVVTPSLNLKRDTAAAAAGTAASKTTSAASSGTAAQSTAAAHNANENDLVRLGDILETAFTSTSHTLESAEAAYEAAATAAATAGEQLESRRLSSEAAFAQLFAADSDGEDGHEEDYRHRQLPSSLSGGSFNSSSNGSLSTMRSSFFLPRSQAPSQPPTACAVRSTYATSRIRDGVDGDPIAQASVEAAAAEAAASEDVLLMSGVGDPFQLEGVSGSSSAVVGRSGASTTSSRSSSPPQVLPYSSRPLP